jgi:hypothetical protein
MATGGASNGKCNIFLDTRLRFGHQTSQINAQNQYFKGILAVDTAGLTGCDAITIE